MGTGANREGRKSFLPTSPFTSTSVAAWTSLMRAAMMRNRIWPSATTCFYVVMRCWLLKRDKSWLAMCCSCAESSILVSQDLNTELCGSSNLICSYCWTHGLLLRRLVTQLWCPGFLPSTRVKIQGIFLFHFPVEKVTKGTTWVWLQIQEVGLHRFYRWFHLPRCHCGTYFLTRSPSSALLPFFLEGSPTKIDYRKELVPLLEDLVEP